MKLQLAIVLVVSGCSSVTMMDGSEGPISDKACDVRVYQTQAQALKQGPIEELCIIAGDSSFSFVHTANVAIEKHKNKACACGATAVYIESRSPPAGFNGPATVSMVAFRYISTPPQKSAPVAVVQSAQPMTLVAAKTADPVAAQDAETAKVVQFLSDAGFPLVGNPVRFKQLGNVTFYEAWGAGGRLTQVVCESGVCRARTIHD